MESINNESLTKHVVRNGAIRTWASTKGLGLACSLVLASCAYVNPKDSGEQIALLDSMHQTSEEALVKEQETFSLVSDVLEQQKAMNTLVSKLNAEVSALIATSEQEKKSKPVDQGKEPNSQNEELGNILKGKSVVGRVEWLWLPGVQRYFASQVNTALDESLIYADEIMRFEREGEPWLRFNVERLNWSSEIEARVTAHKRFSYPGTMQVIKAPVVSIPIELSSYNNAIEFLVVERKKTYPQFVVGRNFLTDIAVVDVSQKYIIARDPDRVKQESVQMNKVRTKGKSESDITARNRSSSKILGANE